MRPMHAAGEPILYPSTTMKTNKNISALLRRIAFTASLLLAVGANANPRVGILIGANSVDQLNDQEKAAVNYFVSQNSDGVVIAPGETSKIDANNIDCIWIHIDRIGLGKGNLPAEISDDATIAALRQYVARGGNLLLTKQATQYVEKIGRTNGFSPNIYGDGDGGKGTDVWTVNAQIGLMNATEDPAQFYDHRNHAIYAGLTENLDFKWQDVPYVSYALEGTGTGAEMWREDHNCCWDLNAYTYAADGANTVEKFQNQNNATVLGTWGHVVDYAVAAVVEFNPASTGAGKILANGLAAYEWAPRDGGNSFHGDIEKLTSNSIKYLSLPDAQLTIFPENTAFDWAPEIVYNSSFAKEGVEVAVLVEKDPEFSFAEPTEEEIAQWYRENNLNFDENNTELMRHAATRDGWHHENAVMSGKVENGALKLSVPACGRYIVTLYVANPKADGAYSKPVRQKLTVLPSFDGLRVNWTDFGDGTEIVIDPTRSVNHVHIDANILFAKLWYKFEPKKDVTPDINSLYVRRADAETPNPYDESQGWKLYGTQLLPLTGEGTLTLMLEKNGLFSTPREFSVTTTGDPTSVDLLPSDDSEAEYFDLQGMRVAADSLLPGIYIKVKNGQSSKILIKE